MPCPQEKAHITSLVVQTRPARSQQVSARINQLPWAEVHRGEPHNKLIVLLETESEQQVLDLIDSIQSMDGVLSTTMVYHHIDD